MTPVPEWLSSISGALSLMPWIILLAVAAPFWWLARRGITPHTPMLIALIAPCGVAFLVLFGRDLVIVVWVIDALLAAAVVIDLATLPRRRNFSAERETLRVASLNGSHQVRLHVTNHSRRAFVATIRDDLPQEFEPVPAEFRARLGPRSRATMHYSFRSRRRGAFRLNAVYVLIRSRFGLWKRQVRLPAGTSIHVYPDMKQMAEYAILARTNRLSLVGVRRTRRIGQDNEFERLRDYTRDDNYKHIDWRATARRSKLTVKDFQTNQSQRLIFLVDCGRMMTNESAGLTLLDHSLNAMLMLSYVALRQGDSVGLLCFSDEIHTFVPPRGGMKQMNQLLHASFDRFPKMVESRYDLAFLYLAAHCRKRSLVVMITNLIDEVNSHQIHLHLGTLAGRHLPMGVLLRDHRLFDAAETRAGDGPDLFRAAAAAEILNWRHQVVTDLEHGGVRALDVFPEDMTAPMINQYLEIKARHLL